MTYHIDSIFGFSCAGVSSCALWFAQVSTPQIEPWLQAGGTLGLITGLAYGCVTLWKANQQQKTDIAELNKEIRNEWKEQSERLVSVLNKLDKDT